jgi:hypothetical protein
MTSGQGLSFDFYVKDRNPSVRFASRAMCCRAPADRHSVSVNKEAAGAVSHRRPLIDNVMGSDFRSQINGYSAQDIANQKGNLVWEGTMETPAPLNEDVTTAFAVDEAMGQLQPGLYVMTATPADIETDSYDRWRRSGSWFPISASRP